MRKKVVWFIIIFVITLIATATVYAGCPNGKITITKSGVYGVVNSDKYNEMDTAIKNNDQNKLRMLITENSVSEIPVGKKVCVIEESFNLYRKRIEVPGFEVPYWVNDAALTQVE